MQKTLVNVLGVVYAHMKAEDGGDIYLSRFAEPIYDYLRLENWYDPEWFMAQKTRLKGTGAVFKVPTKPVNGKSLNLVVKNCRVGEDVPLTTHMLEEFVGADFNSPWEEFSLVMELRESIFGPRGIRINTQKPMLIYVPPETMQPWQSGRSRAKMNRVRARHPAVDLDILKQYKLVYEWIEGYNLPETLEYLDIPRDERPAHLKALNAKATLDLDAKGFLVADMKPEHVIISDEDAARLLSHNGDKARQVAELYGLVHNGKYSVVDYELLARTPMHEAEVKASRRHHYLDDMRDRMVPTEIPAHLKSSELMGVPYIQGTAESTGGQLWVVGRNARLFDYFLPERWRKTPSIRLSEQKEVYYTLTKDNVHLVWKTSRVGELPSDDDKTREALIRERGINSPGFNSPFEEFAIAKRLIDAGVPCAYGRAIYMTGSPSSEPPDDPRRFDTHKGLLSDNGTPVLRPDHDYITIWGFYNGPDAWVAEQRGPLYSPIDLAKAMERGLVSSEEAGRLLDLSRARLRANGLDGSLLMPNDILMATINHREIVGDSSGAPLLVICNLELVTLL